MKSRYAFPFKQDWYSLCSKHYNYDPECEMCKHGSWRNRLLNKIETAVFKYSPKLWKRFYL